MKVIRYHELLDMCSRCNEIRGNFLLITTRPGSEVHALSEVLDALFPLYPSIRVYEVPLRGNILLGVGKSLKMALDLLNKRYTSTIYHIYPLRALCFPRQLTDVFHVCLNLAREALPPGSSFRVKCRRKGRSILNNSEAFERSLGELILRALRDKHLHVNLINPDFLVMVHFLEDLVGVGVCAPSLVLRKPTRWD